MKNKGFTLFELLVSISIIAILTALATISYSSAQKKARDTKRIQDMGLVQKAEELWYMLNSSTYKAGCSSGTSWVDVSNDSTVFVFPTDPKNAGSYIYSASSCGGAAYCVCAAMEGATGNSSNNSCSGWVNGTGTYYCVMNQQ
jgi:prepilin-type N-terminal cleavage/methylation domain-containing protein